MITTVMSSPKKHSMTKTVCGIKIVDAEIYSLWQRPHGRRQSMGEGGGWFLLMWSARVSGMDVAASCKGLFLFPERGRLEESFITFLLCNIVSLLRISKIILKLTELLRQFPICILDNCTATLLWSSFSRAVYQLPYWPLWVLPIHPFPLLEKYQLGLKWLRGKHRKQGKWSSRDDVWLGNFLKRWLSLIYLVLLSWEVAVLSIPSLYISLHQLSILFN